MNEWMFHRWMDCRDAIFYWFFPFGFGTIYVSLVKVRDFMPNIYILKFLTSQIIDLFNCRHCCILCSRNDHDLRQQVHKNFHFLIHKFLTKLSFLKRILNPQCWMVRFQVHPFKGLHCDKGNSENLIQIWISAKISFQLLKFISVSSSAYGIWQVLNNWWSLSMWLLIMSHHSNHLGSPPLASWAFCLFLTFLSSPFKWVQKFLLWPWSMNSGFLLPDYFSDATSLLLFQQLQSICVGIPFTEAQLICWKPLATFWITILVDHFVWN